MSKHCIFKFLIILAVLAIGYIFIPGIIKADGGVFPPPYYQIQESGQKAAIFYEKGKETLILSITFKGDAKDFGWVIPVPQKPEITKGSDEIFTSLQEIVQKYQRYGPMTIEMAPMMGLGEMVEPVTVIETKKIDYYEIAVLSATDSQALAKWLSENGYQYPEESAYILNDYINNQWYFVAVKISPEAEKAEEVVKGLKEGHVTPLKLEFDSEAIIYPLRISAVATGRGLIKLSENLVLNQERIEYLKRIGYEDLTNKEKGPEIFNQIIQDLFAKKNYTNSLASNYPLIISESNYSHTSCWDIRYCQSIVESWFNNYFSRQGLYYYPYQENYIPISLYVIADGKKEIPGFSIEYANWIKAKEIRKLAYDVNGKPLINPQGKKYYLTSLYRYMATEDMTYDLAIRQAENNQRINAPNPWLNLLWGSLIVLGIIFIWLLSPLGIMFVAATLIRGLVKQEMVKIFSKIFQILSFSITLGFLIFFLVVTLKFKPSATAYLWIVSATVSVGLIAIGQIITYIIQSKLTK